MRVSHLRQQILQLLYFQHPSLLGVICHQRHLHLFGQLSQVRGQLQRMDPTVAISYNNERRVWIEADMVQAGLLLGDNGLNTYRVIFVKMHVVNKHFPFKCHGSKSCTKINFEFIWSNV